NPFGSGGMEAMAYRVVHESPDLEGAPAWLEPYLQRSLAKDPAVRPSPELLIRNLRPAVGDAPTLADGVTRLWVPPTNETSLAPTHTPVAAGPPTDHVAPRRGLWVATAVIALLF